MKKILVVIMLSLAAVSPVFSAPKDVEPLVILSLAAPALIAAENPGGDVDLSMTDQAMLLMIPEEIRRSGIRLAGILSDNVITIANEGLKVAMLYAGFDDVDIIGAGGYVSSSFDMDAIETDRLFRTRISFDDASAIYKFGSRASSTSLDGTILLSLSIFSEPLFSLYIDTGDILISGDGGYQGNVLEIRVDLNEDAVYSYFDMAGISLEDARMNAIMMFMMFGGADYDDAIGMDLSSMDYNEIVSVLSEGNLLDVLDAAAFFFEASNDPAMDIPGIATVALKPSLYLNGSPVPGVDLEKAMNRFMDIYSLAEMIG